MAGCGHMTINGQWTMSPCNNKLDATICEMNTGMPSVSVYCVFKICIM